MDIGQAVAAQHDLANALFDQLRRDGLDEPGVTRDPYGPGEQRAHATVTTAAQKLGLRIEHDAAANLYMTLPGCDQTAKPIVVGSHLDSVPHGVPVHLQRVGRSRPMPVVLEERGKSAKQVCTALGGVQRAEHRVGEGLKRFGANGIQ